MQLSSNDETRDLVADEVASNAYIENFALRVFIKADDQDRDGVQNKLGFIYIYISIFSNLPFFRTVAQTFLASSYFLQLLTLFPNPPSDLHQKIKYARFRTTQIMNSLKSQSLSNVSKSSPKTSTSDLPPSPKPRNTSTPSPKPYTSSLPSPKLSSSSPKATTSNLPSTTNIPTTSIPSPKAYTISLPSSKRQSIHSVSPRHSPRASLHSLPSSPKISSTIPLPTVTTTTNIPTSEFQNKLGLNDNNDVKSTSIDPTIIMKAQKHAKWAISALNYEDKDTAINQLQIALNELTK